MTSLPELSRPYVGEYRCETLRWGDRDLLEEGDLRLSLFYDGSFSLFLAGGTPASLTGEYAVSPSGEEITFFAKGDERTFPVEEGDLLVRFPVAGKLLYARFSFS